MWDLAQLGVDFSLDYSQQGESNFGPSRGSFSYFIEACVMSVHGTQYYILLNLVVVEADPFPTF